jgi:RNA polymerase sigma-70 factor (ECF subfamily)
MSLLETRARPMNTHPRHLRPVAAPQADAPAFDADGWVERARRGDVEAWSRVYEAHHPAVYRRLRYLCGDPAVAEELAQETFARAMAHHASYDARRPFAGWLFGIALNIARKHHRKQGNKSRAMQRFKDIVPTGSPDDPAGSHLRRERSRMLYTLLDELPERWREAFVLREVEGVSMTEAAECLGISVSNVAVRVARARARIKEELVRRGWAEGGEP